MSTTELHLTLSLEMIPLPCHFLPTKSRALITKVLEL